MPGLNVASAEDARGVSRAEVPHWVLSAQRVFLSALKGVLYVSHALLDLALDLLRGAFCLFGFAAN